MGWRYGVRVVASKIRKKKAGNRFAELSKCFVVMRGERNSSYALLMAGIDFQEAKAPILRFGLDFVG